MVTSFPTIDRLHFLLHQKSNQGYRIKGVQQGRGAKGQDNIRLSFFGALDSLEKEIVQIYSKNLTKNNGGKDMMHFVTLGIPDVKLYTSRTS